MIRKIFALLLATTMLSTLFIGCSPEQTSKKSSDVSSASEAGSGGTTEWEPATISIYTWLSVEESWGAKLKGEIECFKELEERTNTTIDWSIMSDTNSFDLMMSSGETTDVIWYSWAPARQLKYAKAGLLKDIYSLVQEGAPNVTEFLDSNAKAKKQLVTPEGQMYLIPWVTEDSMLTRNAGPAFRQDWLDKLNLNAPETAEELYNVLKQFRDSDVNGNGEKDEIITGYPSQLYKLMYAFGTADDWMLSKDQKTVLYGPSTENYKTALKWFAKLYEEGILDPDYLSQDSDIYTKKVMADQVALYWDEVYALEQFRLDSTAAGTPIEFKPLKYLKYNGTSVSYNSTSKRVAQQYGAVVSSSAEDPARIVKWLDYMFSDEGSELMNWGIEGVSYKNNNGTLEYTDLVTNDAEYGSSIARSKYAEPTWCGPQSAEAELAMLNDNGKAFREIWADVDVTNAMEPYMFYSDSEQAVIDEKNADLKTEKDTWRDQFITGQKDIDAEWDSYLKALNNMGLEKLATATKGAYDRFINQ